MATLPIVDYYDVCHKDYERVWHLNDCMAMHMGFWTEDAITLKQALLKENEVLAKIAQISTSDHVLDAGCGVGGSSIYLSDKIGCRTTGVTLSNKQVKQARLFANRAGVETLASFETGDFCSLPYEDESFDVVWAIESVCHSQCKELFVSEAFRLLRPGGRLMVADGFSVNRNLNQSEKELLHRSFQGWAVESLACEAAFENYIKNSGFSNVISYNVTDLVTPSLKRLHQYSYLAFIVDVIARKLKRRCEIGRGNIVSAHYQYIGSKKNVWAYKIFCAVKL